MTRGDNDTDRQDLLITLLLHSHDATTSLLEH